MTRIGKPRREIEIEPAQVPDSPAEIPDTPPAERPPVKEPQKVPADV